LIRKEIFKLIIATNRLTLILEKPTDEAGIGKTRVTIGNVVLKLNGLALVRNKTATERETGRMIRLLNEIPATKIPFRSPTI
jgi:hypothetical protein